MFKKGLKAFFCVLCFACLAQSEVDLSGYIVDSTSLQRIQGAVVSCAIAGGYSVSDSIGHYFLVFGSGGSQVLRTLPKTGATGIAGITGSRLHFSVANGPSRVRVEAISLSGQRIGPVVDRILGKGEYSMPLFFGTSPSRIYLLRIQVAEKSSVLKVAAIDSRPIAPNGICLPAGTVFMQASGKTAADNDTLIAWAPGYDVAKQPATTSVTGSYDFKLQRSVPAGSVQVVQTGQAADFLASKPTLTFANDDGSAIPAITVDTTKKYQAILGFGGAFTEATAYNLNKIGAQKRAAIIKSYFSPYTGSGYTVCRTQLQSCDFSVGKYSYDDVAGDYQLANFSLQHETTWMIPCIREAMAVAGSDIKVFASPWSPSAWMKSNNNMLNGGTLLPACQDAWALMFVKYIQGMKDNGVPIWGVTIQNEPEAVQTWESCIYTAASERDFLKLHLGPALALNKVDAKVMIFDHNKDHIAAWATTILGDTAAAKYAWGTAFHWYSGDQFDNVALTHDNFPAKHLLATEEADYLPMYNWTIGQKYAHDIIGDLNSWAEGWVEWNLVLDQNGLPRHDPNTGCAASVDIDFNNDSVHYNPSYYYIAQFSKYLRPGALRMGCTSTLTGLEATAFRNTSGTMVVVAYNNTAAAIAFKIRQGSQIVKSTIPAHAIADYIY
jgi:glucosylceramidase